MIDSLQIAHSLADTLFVKNINNTQFLPVEVITALAALFGVLLSALTNYLVQMAINKNQTKREIQKLFFQKKLDTYLNIPKLIHMGYSNYIEKIGSYALSYDSYNKLIDWISDLEDFFQQNKLLIDNSTMDKYYELNEFIMKDLDKIGSLKLDAENRDLETKKIGVKSCDQVNKLATTVVDSANKYINKQYNV